MRLNLRILICLGMFQLFILASPMDVSAGILFSDGFESGSIGPYGKETCCANSAVVQTSIVRSGKYAVRFESDGGTRRSEINPRGSSGHAGDERWFAYSIYLPKAWLTDSKEAIVTQWHEKPDGCENWRTPPLTMAIAKGNLRFTRKWDTRACTSGGPQGQKVFYLQPLETDKWLDIVLHVKWSYNDDGLVEVWKNGVKIVTEKGANAYNDKQDHYLKIGMYNFQGHSGKRVLYYDNVKIGDAKSSYEEMAIDGKPPENPTEVSSSISLAAGWNLISLPLQTADTSPDRLLSAISNRYAAIYSFDGTNYLSYVPGESSNSLTAIEAGRGYWIYMNEAATLEVKGTAASKNISLNEGWNLAGYNSTQSAQTEQAISSIQNQVAAVYGFDSSTNSYKEFVPGSGGSLETLEPGRGYWIYANEKTSWALP
jgi:hypothetical protein